MCGNCQNKRMTKLCSKLSEVLLSSFSMWKNQLVKMEFLEEILCSFDSLQPIVAPSSQEWRKEAEKFFNQGSDNIVW